MHFWLIMVLLLVLGSQFVFHSQFVIRSKQLFRNLHRFRSHLLFCSRLCRFHALPAERIVVLLCVSQRTAFFCY